MSMNQTDSLMKQPYNNMMSHNIFNFIEKKNKK